MRRNRFQDFMEGRYGNDQLNQCISMIALVLIIVSLFVKSSWIWWIALALLVLMYFRMLSRNTSRRYAENERFLAFFSRFRKDRRGGSYRSGGQSSGYSGQSYGYTESRRRPTAAERQAKRDQRKLYRFYVCPNCSQKVRVPKGKGRIEITCPKCRTSFIKRT